MDENSKLDVTETVKDEQAFMASELPTPKYAWVALFSTWFVSICIPMAWFCLPGIANLFFEGGGFHTFYPNMDPGSYGTNFGLLMNAISWAAIVMAIPTGWVIRRIGPKPTLIIANIATLVGAIGVAAVYSFSYELFLFFRIVEGIGVGMCSVTGPTAVSLWFSNKHRFMAVAIWSTWVPVGMLIVMNGGAAIVGDINNPANLPNLGIVFWGIAIILAIALVQFAILYRLPSIEKGEVTEISIERLDYKTAFPFLKNRQYIGLLISWMLFEFVNFAFTSYDATFLTGVFGVDNQYATLLSSICNAAGILAPIGGMISDRLPWTKKWIMISIGCFSLTLACVFGWKIAAFELFIVMMIFHICGNIVLVGSVRPMVPFLVGRGGATAVAVGLSILTFFQFLGEVLETLVPVFLGIFNTAEAAAMGVIAGSAYQDTATFVLLPVMLVGSFFSLLVRPNKKDREAAKADNNARADEMAEKDAEVGKA
ncbi:MAG: MFS transporter [Coriobacteriales bacterium]|jgi:MFS family permease